MQYISTRGAAPVLTFEQAMLTGLARDGGLYLPHAIPVMLPDAIRALLENGLVLGMAQFIDAPLLLCCKRPAVDARGLAPDPRKRMGRLQVGDMRSTNHDF